MTGNLPKKKVAEFHEAHFQQIRETTNQKIRPNQNYDMPTQDLTDFELDFFHNQNEKQCIYIFIDKSIED